MESTAKSRHHENNHGQHSLEKNETFLVAEGRKAQPKVDIMKTTMANTVNYHGRSMTYLKTSESVDKFPYLLIPDLVRIKGCFCLQLCL